MPEMPKGNMDSSCQIGKENKESGTGTGIIEYPLNFI
jgi:hypothetical protein